MINKRLNKELQEISIKKGKISYYKRKGKCSPSKCGSACCRFVVGEIFKDDYFTKITSINNSPIEHVKLKGRTCAVYGFHCPDITIDGKCKIHNTRRQSSVCNKYPMNRNDAVYLYVKKFCGYTFDKVPIKGSTER